MSSNRIKVTAIKSNLGLARFLSPRNRDLFRSRPKAESRYSVDRLSPNLQYNPTKYDPRRQEASQISCGMFGLLRNISI